MRALFATVYQQAMVVLGPTSESSPNTTSDPAKGYSYMVHSSSSEFDFVEVPLIRSESRVLKTCFSSVPVVEQWELSHQYQELGEALSEMTAFEGADDEWRIEPSVYHAASYVAAKLMEDSVPAPHIFTHGPESVVFNWTDHDDNLYLTISANHISALISSPERITRRMDYSASQLLNPSHLLPFAHLGKPIILISRSDTDLPDFIE